MKKDKSKNKNKAKVDILAAVISTIEFVVLLGASIYAFCLALNIKNIELWAVILILSILSSITYMLFTGTHLVEKVTYYVQKPKKLKEMTKWEIAVSWQTWIAPIAIAVVMLVVCLSGSKVFNATKYADILTVTDKTFAEDIDESLGKESIALMDTDSARMLGDREIGSLTDVVSQFYVSNHYAQIDYQGRPIKVAPLEYGGYFKWLNNKDNGVPGYVTVDPVNMSASYHKYEGVKFAASAFFSENAQRRMWAKYPTKLITNFHFEIDETGKPYYVASVVNNTISLFEGEVITGCVILDPITGDVELYNVEDIPKWVDVVFYGDLICSQYNWYGMLKNGYLNSLFSKQGCTQITSYTSDDGEYLAPDFGYVSKDGDIWVYTGITSCSGDRSNLAFLLANERTGECHKFLVSGADEKSAMTAAEGEVQEKGYVASFPSLINVGNKPTYIMVLKDAGGLVKLYAAVNVEQYNIVTTATTQSACIKQYRKMLGMSTSDFSNADGSTKIKIATIRYIDIDGNTYIYLIDTKNHFYKAKVSDFEEMILLKEGDVVNIESADSNIVAYEKVN